MAGRLSWQGECRGRETAETICNTKSVTLQNMHYKYIYASCVMFISGGNLNTT